MAAIAGLANFTVDGISDTDTANNTTLHFEPNMDSIAEMRVLTANYQAEYGRNSSGTISVVTKSGSQQFHGSAWANKRHEMFNAKSFFQNYNGQQKSVYRFFVWGYSHRRTGLHSEALQHREEEALLLLLAGVHQAEARHAIGLRQRADAGAARGRLLRLHRRQRRAVSAHRPHHRESGSEQQHRGSGRLESGGGQGRTGDSELPAPAEYLRPLTASTPNGCIQDAQYATQQYARNYYWQFNESHPRRNDTLRVDYNVTSKLNTWVRYINDYDLDYTGGNIALKNSAGPVGAVVQRSPKPGTWLRRRDHLHHQPDDGQRIHLRQEL